MDYRGMGVGNCTKCLKQEWNEKKGVRETEI